MGAAREQVEGLGVTEGVAALGQELHIAGERRGVAGDVNDALRRHAEHGVDDVAVDALARRVNDNGVKPHAAARELLRGLARVGTEKLDVFNAVSRGVFPGVPDGGVHDLHAVGAAGLAGKAERDRARAAVEIEHRFLASEVCKVHGGGIEPLGLIVVDLIEAARREPVAQAAERVLDRAGAVVHLLVRAEDGIPARFVVICNNADRLRHRLADGADKRLRMRRFLCVQHHAAKRLPADRAEAQIDVADKPCVRLFIVCRDAVRLHPREHGALEALGAVRLELAAVRRDDLVRPRAEKARDRRALARADGKLHLVAVAVEPVRAGDGQLRERDAADARKGVEHAPALEGKLLLVVHVPEIAAAALAEIRAVGADAVRRGLFNRFDDAVRRAPADVDDADAARLARNGARNKDDLPVRAGNALAVGGVARDGDSQTIVFFHIEFLCFT